MRAKDLSFVACSGCWLPALNEMLFAAPPNAGYQVTEQVGGHGIVGVLRNGDGPTVMIRTDIDAGRVDRSPRRIYPRKCG